MKSVNAREFYHNVNLVEGLRKGEKLLVTSKGKAKFVVTRGGRPRMTRELAEQRAVGASDGKKFDGTAFLKTLR